MKGLRTGIDGRTDTRDAGDLRLLINHGESFEKQAIVDGQTLLRLSL